MKSFAFVLLALGLAAAPLAAQTNVPKPPPAATSRDDARTSINDAGAGVQKLPATTAAPKADAAYIPKEKARADMTILEIVQHGGWAMIPLGVMSVLAVMFILVFFATLRRSAILTSHYMNTADVLLKKRDYLGLLAISSRHSEVVARVVQRTLDFATKNPSAPFDVVKDVAESEGSSQAASLHHRVTYLADIGTLSPMVGLFGTVIGIIRSFGGLGSGISSQNRDWALASGVSEALVATGAGLIVGIVAFTFYAYFRNKVQRLISDLEVASAHIVGLMALSFKKREPSRTAIDEEF